MNNSRLLVPLAFLIGALGAAPAHSQVYSNFRHEASSNPGRMRTRGTGAVTISHPPTAGRHVHFGVPGTSYLRSSVPGTSGSARVLIYRAHPSATYSFSSGRGRVYSSYRTWSVYSSHSRPSRYAQPYYLPPVVIYGAPPVAGPYSVPPVVAPTIVAPPITIPYGGISLTPPPAIGPPQAITAAPGKDISPPEAPIPAFKNGEPLSTPVPADLEPIVDEFAAAVTVDTPTSAVDRIRSLRYETSGDQAFRNGQYPDAEAFYETAARTAKERRSAWLRLTWAQIAQQKFPEAATSFRKAMSLNDDLSTAWIAAEALYGQKNLSHAWLHNEALLKWVEQRPLSTDRLLLAAAYQMFLGRGGTAGELLKEAERLNAPSDVVASLITLNTRLIEQRRPARQLRLPDAQTEPAGDLGDADQEGIRIHGDEDSPAIPQSPEPVSPPVLITPQPVP